MLNFDWLSGVSAETAKWIFLIFFGLIGVLVVLIPNDYVFEGVPQGDRRWWNNLKLWAIGVLLILSFIYYIF
ncbi:hypothetical protein QQ020_33700 [Fulvivirgaceae bacterium BMA12]|uniref:Uncharacterized protein n=1 Tax=Agaribacillus aureus TaxID=3051825 RepID=A0ABT8LGZ3_9BACT|nr:hypothetical protein [Fulvivirgaceae bacterium BMA12]